MVTSPRAKLRIVEGIGSSKVFSIVETPLTLGRHTGADVVLRDNKLSLPDETKIVSRNHAKIVYQDGRWVIIDNSVNGTIVDGKEVSHGVLHDGSTIGIGSYVFEFTILPVPRRAPTYEPSPPERVAERPRVPISSKENPFLDFTRTIKALGLDESQVGRAGFNWRVFAFVAIAAAVVAILLWMLIR